MKLRPIDNLRALLDGGSPDWIPFTVDVGAFPGLTEPVMRKFREATGADDPDEYFQTDNRLFSLTSRLGGDNTRALRERVEPDTTFDEWGIGHWAGGTEGSLDKAFPPLDRAQSVREIEAHPSPVIETGVDTSAVARFHAAGYPVFGYAGSIYEWSWWLRGMESFMMDLVSEPAMAEAVVRKVEAHTTGLAMASADALIARRPVFAVMHAASTASDLLRRVGRAPTVRLVSYGEDGHGPNVDAVARELSALIDRPCYEPGAVAEADAVLEPLSACSLAGRLANVLDRCLP